MPTAPIPRDQASARAAAIREQQEAYAAHLTLVQAAEIRVGAVDWSWRIARRDPGGPWVTLDATLEHYPAEDLARHRRRLAPWLCEQLGVKAVWLTLDYSAEEQGRLAFTVEATL